MKKIIFFCSIIAVIFALASTSRNNTGYRFGEPAFAACTADNIRNNCCVTFFKALQSETVGQNQKTREQKAVAEFGRCMRYDMGCSEEMIGLKTKSAGQIRQICR